MLVFKMTANKLWWRLEPFVEPDEQQKEFVDAVGKHFHIKPHKFIDASGLEHAVSLSAESKVCTTFLLLK